MLKDITLGQYFPGDTVVHRLDPRTKLLMVIVYIVALFLAKWVVSYAVMLAFLVTAVALSRIRPRAVQGPEAAAVYHHFYRYHQRILYQGRCAGAVLDL